MQIFAATYLPGAYVILLSQAAIPVSMLLSRVILKKLYHKVQYVCAVVVCVGIIVVLFPSLTDTGGDDDDSNAGSLILWAMMMILSCVPMCLSSIYKEIALGETELDPIYLNAWIAVFQFLFSIPLTIPAALMSDPPVHPADLPSNLWNGLKCWFGVSMLTCDADDDSCYSDQCYLYGPLYVNIYIIFNVGYNILIIMILKWGSANLLWLAMTVMVPLGSIAFALPFMPEAQKLTVFVVIGLLVILAGLFGYRMGPDIWDKRCKKSPQDEFENDLRDTKEQLLVQNS